MLCFLQRRPAADDSRQGDNRRQGNDRWQGDNRRQGDDTTIGLESCGIGHTDRRPSDNRQCAGHALRNRCDKVPSVPSYFLNYWQSKHYNKTCVLRDKQSVVSAEQNTPPFY